MSHTEPGNARATDNPDASTQDGWEQGDTLTRKQKCKKKISIDDGTVVSNLKEERLEVIISDEQHAGGKAAEEWK